MCLHAADRSRFRYVFCHIPSVVYGPTHHSVYQRIWWVAIHDPYPELYAVPMRGALRMVMYR